MPAPRLAAALGLVAAFAAPSLAQPTLSLSATVTDAYVWRGVTMADQPSLQGDLSVAVPASGWTLTGGAWTNWEIDPDPARFSTLTGPVGGVGELDLYAQAARPLGDAAVALGVTALRFPEIPAWNTTEVFGSIALAELPLSPALVVRKDVDAVGGAYAELSVSRPLALLGRGLTLGGNLGATTGQDEDGDLAWYAGEGLTHAVLSLSTSLPLGEFTLTPLVNVTHGFDDYARVNGEATRVGVALTLSTSAPLRR